MGRRQEKDDDDDIVDGGMRLQSSSKPKYNNVENVFLLKCEIKI